MPAYSRSNAVTFTILSSAIAVAIAAPAMAQQAPQPAELPPVVVEGSQTKAKAPKKVAKKSAAPKSKAAPAPAAPAPQPDDSAAAAAGGEETAKGAVDGVVAKRSATGTKTDTPIISTPQSISVVGREQMERQGAQSVVEATRYSPGIRSETFGSDTRNDWFLLRGFPAQTTGYYLDGLQLYSTAFATWRIEPWGLDRIDIIRGPSAVLYGGGNPGGLINAVSKRPELGPVRTLSTGIDEHGNGYGAIDVGGRLGGSGEVTYRVNALGRAGGTQVDDIDNDRFFIAPSLTWRPSADTSITLLASYQKDKTEIQNFLPYVGTVTPGSFGRISTSLNTNNPGYGEFKREQAMIGYEFEHRFSNALSIRQNLRYGELDVDLIGLYGRGLTTPGGSSLERGNFVTLPRAEQFNVDNQAEVRFDTGFVHHKFLAGVDYKHYKLDDEQGYEQSAATRYDLATGAFNPVGVPVSRYNDLTTTQEQLGFYLQDQMKIDRLTLALSGRHDSVETQVEDRLFSGDYSGDETAFTYRAGAIYNFDNGIAPYVSYSTSFDPQVGLNARTGQPLLAEEGEGFEVGVKYEPQWFKGRFTAAYFDITKSNVLTATVTGPPRSEQIAEVRSEGFEFEAVATLLPGLDLISSYTVYDLTAAKDLDPLRNGKVPVGVPEQFGGLFLDYTFQSGPMRGFGFGAGVRYNGRSFADIANTLEVPDYTLADAALHYETGAWLTSLNVSNVFDDTYVSSCAAADACYYGDRRKVMVNATYKW